jgi:hypothetical protein
LYCRLFEDKLRPTVLLAVVLFHCLLAILLTRVNWLRLQPPVESEPFNVIFLPHTISSHANASSRTNAITAPAATEAPQKTAKNAAATDDAISTPSQAPPPPPIEWMHEAELAIQNGMAKAETERQYRNLSRLSPSQLAWARRMHPALMNADSVFEVKHDSHCAFIGTVFFCEMKIGRRKVRWDLFKNMREFLDERLIDPLP